LRISLFKKELDDIISERVYVFAFFVQFVIVLGIVYAALLYTSVAAPETSSFVQVQRPKIGIVGNDADLLSKLSENLDIVFISGEEPFNEISNQDLVAAVVIKSNSEFEVYLDNTKLLSGFAETVIDSALSDRGAELRKEALEKKMETADIVLSPIIINEFNVGEEGDQDRPPEFIMIMYGLLIPFILLLPTFLATNMVTDSIVGEKERKTYEILIISPVTKRMIILSKIGPPLAVAIIQSLLWILIFIYKDIPVHNILFLMILLLIINVIFIGFGVLISAFSDTLKESNLTVTIAILVTSIMMFAPIGMKSVLQELNPISTITKLASNPVVQSRTLFPLIPLALIAVLIMILGEISLKKIETLRL